jgi:ABC-type uncharacterized transport system substrate-binding protein
MKRREFITLLGRTAAAWPVVARAQRPDRMRRIGVLMHLATDDAEGQRRIGVFLQGLQEAGWAVGRNVDIDVRWAAGEADRFRRYAVELIALMPDVVLASATPSVMAMQQVTRNVPIVFVLTPDPVGSGIVDSLSHPGRNATGFTSNEFGLRSNGWNCSNRWHPTYREWQYFETRQTRPGLASLAPSRARRLRWG